MKIFILEEDRLKSLGPAATSAGSASSGSEETGMKDEYLQVGKS